MTMSKGVMIIASFLALVGLVALQTGVNTKKEYRYRQVLLPVIAFVYCLAIFILLVVGGMKDGVSLVLLSQYAYAVNPLIVAGFVVIKFIYNIIAIGLFRSQGTVSAVAGGFYEFSDKYSEWFLLEKWKNVKQIFFAFIVAGVIAGGIFYFTGISIGEGAAAVGFVPAILLVVIVEIYAFLGGNTESEFDSIFGDNASSQKVSNFYRIRNVYEGIFPDNILVANTGCDYIATESPEDYVNRYKESENSRERDSAEYFKSNASRNRYDTDCMQAAIDLVDNKNVVFFNPFYRDLGKYLVVPIVNTLLDNKNILVVVGRSSTREDVRDWIDETIRGYSKMDYLWKTDYLTKKKPDCEIGIMDFSQVYDLETLGKNREFFRKTKLVILVEPSLSVNTGQIGLRMISEYFEETNDSAVYCVIDRHTDGIVDILSHLLQTDLTTVIAPPVPRCCYTGMGWNADGDYIRQKLFDKQAKYLGNGVELAAVAIKNQIPKVSWYSETKAPVKDIRWIAGQYYDTLCKYMHLKSHQQSIYDKIDFVSNMWNASEKAEQFIIVEDEFNNIFSTIRAFLSRGEDQAFINVMSENYLLRDYMRCNKRMFMTNPNAVPSVVSDYAKTERNILIKSLMQMASSSIRESEIAEELELIGQHTDNVPETLEELLRRYTFADHNILLMKPDPETLENVFSIKPEVFRREFADTLNNAYYIVEEEERETEYIDAKLYGHVTQTILPGQFMTYAGKYYVAKHISSNRGVVLRRASDLYTGRKYYRQIRKYVFDERPEYEVISSKKIMDIELSFLRENFHVTTSGYLELNDYNDLREARVVDFSADPETGVYERRFKNKTVFRIGFADSDAKERLTLCMLLSEIFKSVFPNTWQYLAVVSPELEEWNDESSESHREVLKNLLYSVEGDVDDGYIYIIEDSDIDLGLLEAIERNFMSLMELVTDYISWHLEKIVEPDPEPIIVGEVQLPADIKKLKFFAKLLFKIKKKFGKKSDEDEAELPEIQLDDLPLEEQPPEDGPSDEQPTEDGPSDEESATEDKESPSDKDATSDDNALEDGDEVEVSLEMGFKDDDEVSRNGASGITKYQRECFLKFGFEDIDDRFKLEELKDYLTARDCADNAMLKARKREAFDPSQLDLNAVNHCDFCGMPLSGVSYRKLSDGRICCNDCGTSAINTVEEFRELFKRIQRMYEGLFSIEFRVGIAVGMTDAKTVAKHAGCVFVPSTGYAARVLGFAQRKNGRFTILMENGSPRLATTDTMVHELTHIWQFTNWNDKAIAKLYGTGSNRDIVYEGMAMWAAVQYLYLTGESSFAQQAELLAEQRNDVYGIGFRLYREKYPFAKDISQLDQTPFTVFPPL